MLFKKRIILIAILILPALTGGLVAFLNKHLLHLHPPGPKNSSKIFQSMIPSGPANHLQHEKSPYLLQHADNPVHWYPWGEEAFAAARKEDKPVFLSIGYSACHWCHVMAEESFENPQIAEILNKYFIAIKVDREERPDIDRVYMKSVIALTGSGGWPLSVFLTQDKKPFYGGTYFPPERREEFPGFKELLLSIHNAWITKRDQLIQSGLALSQSIHRPNETKTAWRELMLGPEILDQSFARLKEEFDSQYGGFGQAPKFPLTQHLVFLLRYWNRTNNPGALAMVEETLQSMAHGGIYDHLGGGFHRYTVDQKWQRPHFEKMLYDQALLSGVYLESYQATGKELYAQVARETFDYVLREMMTQEGGFSCARDADSLPPSDGQSSDELNQGPKKEGAFYLWSQKEIITLLGQESAQVFNYSFGIAPAGAEDQDKNILWMNHSSQETAARFNKSVAEIDSILNAAKQKLFEARARRPKPFLDDKILTDWNGLMIASLAFGSRILNDPRYVAAAEKSAQMILKRARRSDGRLWHRFRDGEAAVLGSLEDYSFFIYGLIHLYEATFKVQYLQEAVRLIQQMIDLFWDQERGGFFSAASDAEQVLYREKELADESLPAGNAIATWDLLALGTLTIRPEWEKMGRTVLQFFKEEIQANPTGYLSALNALDFTLGPSMEIVFSGELNDPAMLKMLQVLDQRFFPNKVMALRPMDEKESAAVIALIPFIKNQISLENKTTAYVCKNHQCELPTTDVGQFERYLDKVNVEPENILNP